MIYTSEIWLCDNIALFIVLLYNAEEGEILHLCDVIKTECHT